MRAEALIHSLMHAISYLRISRNIFFSLNVMCYLTIFEVKTNKSTIKV